MLRYDTTLTILAWASHSCMVTCIFHGHKVCTQASLVHAHISYHPHNPCMGFSLVYGDMYIPRPQGVHTGLTRACSHMIAPSQSLHGLLTRVWCHVYSTPTRCAHRPHSCMLTYDSTPTILAWASHSCMVPCIFHGHKVCTQASLVHAQI